MDATEKIKFLLDEKGWSAYRLSKECGLSANTILTMLKRNSVPSITTLEAICKAFGITISEFFAEGEMIEVSEDTRELLNYWSTLSQRQKENLLNFIKNFNK